jgi:hypothetical protein
MDPGVKLNTVTYSENNILNLSPEETTEVENMDENIHILPHKILYIKQLQQYAVMFRIQCSVVCVDSTFKKKLKVCKYSENLSF